MVKKRSASPVAGPDLILNLDQLSDLVRACRECPLYTKGRACPGVGTGKADIMMVGQAPGIDENRLGQPFVGQAGQFLSDCLLSVGIKDSLIYWTNVVKHFPGRNQTGDDCPPFAIEACKHWLDDEYRLVQPKLIVAVGAIAMHFFGIRGGINQNAGFVTDTEQWGPVLPILHPAGLMRKANMSKTPQFVTQLNAIGTFLNGKTEPPPYGPN